MNDEQNALLSKNKWKQSERARQTNPDQTRPGVHNVHKLSQAQPMLKQKKAGEKKKLCHNKNAKRVCPPTHVHCTNTHAFALVPTAISVIQLTKHQKHSTICIQVSLNALSCNYYSLSLRLVILLLCLFYFPCPFFA